MTADHEVVPRNEAARINPLIDSGTLETLRRVAYLLNRIGDIADSCAPHADTRLEGWSGMLGPAAAALWFEADQLERAELGDG